MGSGIVVKTAGWKTSADDGSCRGCKIKVPVAMLAEIFGLPTGSVVHDVLKGAGQKDEIVLLVESEGLPKVESGAMFPTRNPVFVRDAERPWEPAKFKSWGEAV